MILNEVQQKWSNIIKEEYNITDQKKLSWMSQYAQNHEIFEGVQSSTGDAAHGGIYATPLSTMGMGNPLMPRSATDSPVVGTPGGAFGKQIVGSGDIPMSTLTMALEIAAVTIGLELVPVIPSPGPWTLLSYMDFPYAGGKLDNIGNLTSLDGKGPDAENKPIFIKVPADFSTATDWAAVKRLSAEDKWPVLVSDEAADAVITGEYIGISRIDASVILRVKSVKKGDADVSIAEAMKTATKLVIADKDGATPKYTSDVWAAGAKKADLVAAAADHVQGFANFSTGSADPMSRAENETGTGNALGARMFTKLVQMGSYEATGAVTRQQLQDMPLYGVDVIGKVLEQIQNTISQHINNRILDRVFKLGVDNATFQYKYQGVDLNLYLNGADATTGLALKDFDAWAKYAGSEDVTDGRGRVAQRSAATTAFGEHEVPRAVQNTAAENLTTHQRRIMSRLLASANLIANVSRRGRGQWAVTNTQVLSALQDASAFVVAPMVNTLTQDGSQSLYFAGSIAGLNLYVDPYMTWDDTRICVGRKSNGNDPGVIFMPYILADTVQTIVEGTMAPKLLVNSRFAIVDAGFHPEQSYYTFMVQTGAGTTMII